MKHELIMIVEKIELHTCRSHEEKATIKIIRNNIQISCCCGEFKKYLERKIEYELYKQFNQEEMES